MHSLKVLIRWVGLVAVVSFPIVLVGSAVSGKSGAVAGLISALLFIGLIAVGTEKIIAQAYGAQLNIPAGLGRSLAFVLKESQFDPSRILVYPEPFPSALVVRGLGGQGSILISQGLVALLRETE